MLVDCWCQRSELHPTSNKRWLDGFAYPIGETQKTSILYISGMELLQCLHTERHREANYMVADFAAIFRNAFSFYAVCNSKLWGARIRGRGTHRPGEESRGYNCLFWSMSFGCVFFFLSFFTFSIPHSKHFNRFCVLSDIYCYILTLL